MRGRSIWENLPMVLWTRECMRGKRNKLYALH